MFHFKFSVHETFTLFSCQIMIFFGTVEKIFANIFSQRHKHFLNIIEIFPSNSIIIFIILMLGIIAELLNSRGDISEILSKFQSTGRVSDQPRRRHTQKLQQEIVQKLISTAKTQPQRMHIFS